ncbi:glycosyltransferase [Pseudoalteromonas rubra]|uniref:Glycosyltransferase n=1 Tax=Pseudoalteromonas rubra TaxID=43658 RepID=A0A4Q7EDF9_9GAMM|nr:glycosyltransferase [Pseudoalteromonas rubra]RZM81162.1 hypothetical protein C3B51_09235 [Pseudoalteromonas rubra]
MNKLLMIINSSSGGGAEKVFNSLYGGLKEENELDVYYLYLKGNSTSRFWKFFAVFRYIWTLVKVKPDVVQSHLLFPNMLNVFLCRLFNYKSQIVCHSSFERFEGSKIEVFIKKLYGSAHSVICVSKEMANQAKCFLGKPGCVEAIYNPHDLEKYEALAEKNVQLYFDDYFVVVGRLIKSKRINDIIDVLKKTETKENLLVVGDGEEYHTLLSHVKELGMDSRVKFTGSVDNPYPYIRNAKAMLLASETEGFPNCLVESLALGVPVITSNCKTGPAELLGVSYQETKLKSVYKNCFIYPVGDLEGLEEAIKRFRGLNDNESELKGSVAALNLTDVVKQYSHSIGKLLNNKV